MSGPVEVKVSTATIASAVTGLGLWSLQTYVFHDAVPLPVLAAVQTVVPAVVTFLAGYLAPHTPRPDLDVEPSELDDTRGAVIPSVDNSVDRPGRHVLDGDPGEIPVSRWPSATRYDVPDKIDPPQG